MEDLARLRERLRAIDPKLNVWWIPKAKREDTKQPGRWAAVYYMASERNRIWSNVFYWEDAAGGFKKLSLDMAEPFLNYLREHELADPLEHNRQVEEEKAKSDQASLEELYHAADTVGRDMHQRIKGVRQTFGHHGALRSRKFIRGDMSGEVGNAHSRWLRERNAR